jgi:CheY-like chemotaxis protein
MRVLFVDDYMESAAALAELSGILGHDAHYACTVEDACSWATKWAPEMIFLDIWIGKDDGRDLCRTLRRLPQLSECKFVAMTGDSTENTSTEDGLFDERLPKPLGIDALERLLKNRV